MARLRVAHERCEGEVDDEDAEADRDQQQRLHILGHGEPNEEEPQGPHDHHAGRDVDDPHLSDEDLFDDLG